MLRTVVLGITLWSCFAFTLPAAASAATTLNSDGRSLVVNGSDAGCGFSDTVILPSPPFAPFVASHSVVLDGGPYPGAVIGAAQNTTVGATHMGGTGSATNLASGHFCGASNFGITFSVDSSTPYVFEGTLETTTGGNASYFLSRRLAGGSFETGGAAWSFDFTLAPEPSTASLLALGIGALAASRRRPA